MECEDRARILEQNLQFTNVAVRITKQSASSLSASDKSIDFSLLSEMDIDTFAFMMLAMAFFDVGGQGGPGETNGCLTPQLPTA